MKKAGKRNVNVFRKALAYISMFAMLLGLIEPAFVMKAEAASPITDYPVTINFYDTDFATPKVPTELPAVESGKGYHVVVTLRNQWGNDIGWGYADIDISKSSQTVKVKEFGNVFGVEVDPKKATSREFQILNHKGRVISKGIGSGLTGHSGHLIVIDDPIKNRVEADSERTRESIWNEFMDSILTRTQAGSKIILIMTRWHEDDLAGRILQQMPNVVTYVNYECECESENDPLERRRKTEDRMGEALCPEIGKGDAWLREFKAAYVAENGRRSWEALYQGHPTIQEGNILQKKWWQKYIVEEYYEGKLRFDQLIMTVDATFKDSEKNDYVAIEVWGKRENRFYLVDLVNEHLSFSNTCHRIRLLQAKHPKVMGVYIEDAANGPAILDHMRHEISGLIPIKPDKASKEARVWAVEPLVEAECVYVPKDKDWHHDFIEQCAKFPNDKHDDMVDAMSMALTRLHFSTKGWIRRKVEEATGWNLPSDMPKKKIDVGRKIHRI